MSYIRLWNSTFTSYRLLNIGNVHGEINTPGGDVFSSGGTLTGGTIHGNTIPSMSGSMDSGHSLVIDEHGTDLSNFIENASDTTYYLVKNNTSKKIVFQSNSSGKCKGISIMSGSTAILYVNQTSLINNIEYSELVFVNGTALKPEEQLFFMTYCGNWVGPVSGTVWYLKVGGKCSLLLTALREADSANFDTLWASKSLISSDAINPYEDGGYSGTGGGDRQKQNWSESSDFVKADLLPDESHYGAQVCGLITIFTPTKDQLQKLSDVLWGRSFWEWVQSQIQNISDLFISLGMVPFTISPGPTVEVTWLNYVVAGAVSFTDIYLNKCSQQFMEFNMGSISLDGSDNRVFAMDSALDYSPYSKLGIYLPFIGYQELDIDECRNQTLTLRYRIDVLSGTTVAIIDVGGRDIYQFTGNCLTQLPITGADYQTMITNAVNLGLSLASAGATAAVASAGDAVAAERVASGKLSEAGAGLDASQRGAQVANSGGGALSATANAVMGMKPNFKKSGGIGASASLLSVKQPYLFITTPRQSMPAGYNKVCGFPCNIYDTLGSFSGYTVVEDIRLNGLVATSSEVEEIYNLLKSGVII